MPQPVSYLQGDTDHETHDTRCCCDIIHSLPHQAIGASLYQLDLEGARAWHALCVGKDDGSFAEWQNNQESQSTHYGITSEAAIDAALAEAQRNGWLVINAPEPAQTPLRPDYQDARASLSDTVVYYRYHREPHNPPMLTPEEGPFPLWIVPPGYRLARLSDIRAAAGYDLSPDEAGVLLTLTGVLYTPLDLFGWKDAMASWEVSKTGDTLVLWHKGWMRQ